MECVRFTWTDRKNQVQNECDREGRYVGANLLDFRLLTFRQTYTLPLRKAAPLASSIDGSRSNSNSPSIANELHSPLSPLSPGSPLYPDGVFTPLWLTKHQVQVPVLFIAFFDILAASTVNANQDEQLKSDISSMRAAITKSGFKTKLAVVLVSDRSILQAPELEDRMLSIRRATGLDSKTGLFFVPPMSAIELSSFVQSMLTTMQPLCIDYYRDLTKHARRKKTRVSPSPLGSAVSGSIQPLSGSGWNTRYEVKQGVFAEFRQEMETADRHYSAAIDELFSTEGVLEMCPTSSPRWSEARVLCDILALRILRCQLKSSSTTGAAQSWINYRIRVAELLVRRGLGLDTQEWVSWKTRWAEIMAQLIDRAKLHAFQVSEKKQDESVDIAPAGIYAMPEKPSAAIDRIRPMNNLHHSGYWLQMAAKDGRNRRGRPAVESEGNTVQGPLSSPNPERAANDQNHMRNSADESNDSNVTNSARLAQAAVEQFRGKDQIRMAELIKLDLAQDYFDAKRYGDAESVLTQLWEDTTWRQDGWYDLLADLLVLLRQCAIQLNQAEIVLGATYELLGTQSALADNLSLDLARCLDNVETDPSNMVSLDIQDQQKLCPIAATFAFENKQTHVGEPLGCQLILASRMNESVAAVTLSSAKLHFGTSKVVSVTHKADNEIEDTQLVDFSDVAESIDGSLDMEANLTLGPKDRRIFNFVLRFRNAQTARLSRLVLAMKTEKFNIEHSFTEPSSLASDTLYIQSNSTFEQKFLRSMDAASVVVLPKPPKVQIVVHGVQKEYYTDEVIPLDIEIINSESDSVAGKIGVQVNGERDTTLALQWKEGDGVEPVDHEAQSTLDASIMKTISPLNAGQSLRLGLRVAAPAEPLKTSSEISLDYTLSSDKTAQLRKSFTLDLNFLAPFETKFNFGPLLYPDPWPSYFDPNSRGTTEHPDGIPQLWMLSCQLRSLAKQDISMRQVEALVDSASGDSHAATRNRDAGEKTVQQPGQLSRHSFEMRTQKYSLDDRRPTTIESTLHITWSRDHSTEPITTRIRVPRLTLPVSEPRVLCTLAESEEASEDFDAILHYHIENPSTHFLTFAITMEASEDFAFRGPKARSLSLAPMSRHKVEYCMALHDADDTESEGGKWIWPNLQVVDSYYQKTLRVHPAGDDVKVDEKGNIGVWIETS